MKGKWSVVLLHSEICRIRFAKQDLPLVNVCGLGLAPWLVTLSVICPTAFLGIKIRLMGFGSPDAPLSLLVDGYHMG